MGLLIFERRARHLRNRGQGRSERKPGSWQVQSMVEIWPFMAQPVPGRARTQRGRGRSAHGRVGIRQLRHLLVSRGGKRV